MQSGSRRSPVHRRSTTARGPAVALTVLLTGLATTSAGAARPPLAVRDLGTFQGFDSYGQAINDRGRIVGTVLFAPGNVHSFLWNSGVKIDLGPLEAIDINNRGQVLLESIVWPDPDTPNTCYLRNGNTLIDLGIPADKQ